MTDNVQITAGSGTVIATDGSTGANYQRIKITDGTEGSTTPAFVTPDFNALAVAVQDLQQALMYAIENIANPSSQDPATGRLRVTVDNVTAGTLPTVTTVGTVTTVSTVTNMSQIGAISANELVFDMATLSWADAVRGRIT